MHELEVKLNDNDTLTRNLNMTSLERQRHLASNGVAHIGSLVHEGDILVGKVTIENQGQHLDTPLKVPTGITMATVCSVSLSYSNASPRRPAPGNYSLHCNLLTKKYVRHINAICKHATLVLGAGSPSDYANTWANLNTLQSAYISSMRQL